MVCNGLVLQKSPLAHGWRPINCFTTTIIDINAKNWTASNWLPHDPAYPISRLKHFFFGELQTTKNIFSSCDCPQGFAFQGGSCHDVDECLERLRLCGRISFSVASRYHQCHHHIHQHWKIDKLPQNIFWHIHINIYVLGWMSSKWSQAVWSSWRLR